VGKFKEEGPHEQPGPRVESCARATGIAVCRVCLPHIDMRTSYDFIESVLVCSLIISPLAFAFPFRWRTTGHIIFAWL